MTTPPLPDLPGPDPSPAALRAWLRKYRQAQRDEQLRRGRGKPRTHREIEIWLAARRNRDAPKEDPP